MNSRSCELPIRGTTPAQQALLPLLAHLAEIGSWSTTTLSFQAKTRRSFTRRLYCRTGQVTDLYVTCCSDVDGVNAEHEILTGPSICLPYGPVFPQLRR